MKLYSVILDIGDDMQAQSIVAGKKAAIAIAKKWHNETEDARRVRVRDAGTAIMFFLKGQHADLENLGATSRDIDADVWESLYGGNIVFEITDAYYSK